MIEANEKRQTKSKGALLMKIDVAVGLKNEL